MKRISLTAWIFIGMAAGVALGIFAPDFARQLGLVSTVFLRLIRSIIAPLLFGTLVSGIAGGGDLKHMGRIGAKAILYFEIVTTFALFLFLGIAEQHEEQGVVHHDHVRGEKAFARLLVKTARVLATGFLRAEVRFAANLGPDFRIGLD